MVSGRGISAAVCVAIGLGCASSVLRGHGSDHGAVVVVAAATEPRPEAAAAPVVPAAPAAPIAPAAEEASAEAAVDTSLPTGSIAPGSALHAPNPAAYADAAKAGSSLILTGAEAINYLAGNTLRREGPREPLHFTYFASRGLMGEGNERGFTARRWDREHPEFCEPGPDGNTLCRSITILLDGKYEFPGARLGTVKLGAPSAPDGAAAGGAAAGGAAAGGATPPDAADAVLVKGNAIHFPEHIPFLDSSVDVAGGAPAENRARAAGADAIDRIVGSPMAAGEAGGRQVLLYTRDNRRLELQEIEDGAEGRKAVRVTVGHWRNTKATLCQTRVIGDAAQACFRAEAAADGVRLVPAGKAGEAQTLTVLPEAGARAVAQD